LTYILELREITTIYPADHFMANRNVSLSLRTGEILCLVGENGAGKTSLMKVLCGFIQPAQGEIFVKGNPVSITSPLGAAQLGIGMVHQHFMLFPDFSVVENVVMGREPVKMGFVYDIKTAVERVNALIKAHEFSIKAHDRVSDLSIGQLQQVEIVKLLYRNADILILDEPSAALTEQETVSLFQTLRLLAKGGKSLILITHRLSEIKRISDRVAVMRKGELVALRETAHVDEYEISQLMLGRDINRTRQTMSQEDAPQYAAQKAVLSFNKVTVKRRKQEQPLLNELSFTAHGGEILAFVGAGNSGLEELEAVLGGLLPISSGIISHRGTDISRMNAESLRKRNLAYVPADRLNVGSEARALISENIMIVRRREMARHGILNRAAISHFCHTLFERFAIRGNKSLRIGSLSGGNIQKLVLAREIDLLERGGDYIVFSKPTWGLDVAASNAVYEQMTELRQRGVAILLLSSNLDEIIALADRVLVLYRGSIVAELDTRPPDADLRELIGAYMLGIQHDDSAQVAGVSTESCSLRQETQDSPPRDTEVPAERRGSLHQETRKSPPRDAEVSTERRGSLRREIRKSPLRDTEVSTKRRGSLCQETRESPPRDTEVSTKRRGSLHQETRKSPPKDTEVSTKRRGSLRQEIRKSPLRDTEVSTKRRGSLHQETRKSPPRDMEVFGKTYDVFGERYGSLRREIRKSPPRDTEVSAKRYGSLRQEIRKSPPRDTEVSTKRRGSPRREIRKSPPRDAGVSTKRHGSLHRETRRFPPRDVEVSAERRGSFHNAALARVPAV
jgi:simple sugar transport system ATP-binding protein